MNSKIIGFDHWRNFQPFAPDIEISARAGVPVNIDLKPYLMQGARDLRVDYIPTIEEDTNGDGELEIIELPPVMHPPAEGGPSPTPGVLEKIPVQRGWLCSPVVENQPGAGFARLNDFKDGLLYSGSSKAEVGFQDCFNYFLTNGTQRSRTGKITITIERYYRIDFVINRYIDGSYSFSYSFDTANGLAPPSHYIFAFWNWTGPIATWNEDRQLNEIKTVTRTFHNSQWKRYDSGHIAIVDNGVETPKRHFDDDTDLVGVIDRTSVPYRPTGDKPQITLRLDLYRTYQYAHGAYFEETLEFDLSAYFETNWWESGQIQQGI